MRPAILLLFSSWFSGFGLFSGQMSSGDYILPDENESNASCIVPAYSQPLYEVNASAENVKLLLVEGRCYLICLTKYKVSEISNIIVG